MTYKIKKKSQKIPEGYFEKKELERFRKKYKGKFPPFFEITRIATRRTARISPKVHKKGAMVEYRDGIARVKKVTKKGLYLQPYETEKDKILSPKGKIVFIPEKRVDREVYPFYLFTLS